MEEEIAKEAVIEDEEPNPFLFPLLPVSGTSPPNISTVPQWLSNTSFSVDLSVINENLNITEPEDLDERVEEIELEDKVNQPTHTYDLLESSASDDASAAKRDKRDKNKRKRKRKQYSEDGAPNDYGSRKSGVRSWAAASNTKPTKEYFFDSRGDRDSLAFGCLYRMDVPRHKLYSSSSKLSGIELQAFYGRNQRGSILDREADIDASDSKLKSSGRYWSAKYSVLERHKSLKRFRVLAPRKPMTNDLPGDFIPIFETKSDDGGTLPTISVVEESWEDEVLRKTREFNKTTREHPHDEKVWLAFAEFQDRVASMQPNKGARLQILEKKISILEKATELNPENEELILYLLKAYQSRDSTDVLLGKWEKILIHHSGSYKLWEEFLRVVRGEFSRFKVSEMRRMYAHAIQALSMASNKQHRHVHQTDIQDPSTVKLELGLVDIFVSLCRFEWQAGYQELATALLQAEVEYSLFCPCLLLTEQNKQRLFEHFWNSDGARVGEEGAIGWSTWLEKEEENRQKIVKEEIDEDDKGGWTGWSEPLSKGKDATSPAVDNVVVEEFEEEMETEDSKQEDDTEALLKMLGIDADHAADSEVKDSSTWTRWAKEESLRGCDQWMPIHTKSAVGASHSDPTPEGEVDEGLMRVILFEDVREYLFSLCSEEARLYLVSQFIDFFGGNISQWTCTNSSSWTEKTLSLEALSDSILEDLRRVHESVTNMQSTSTGFSLELLLDSSNDTSWKTVMMNFLRNAILLCLSTFPRNYILEEAALIAEDLSITKMNSHSCSVTPCRALAKQLLKSDRQDIILCGVYARREAAFGNIDHPRRVFDMALSSIVGLPLNLQSNAPLLYFWYAEMELANSSENTSRAVHILSCLGSGVTYIPFKSQPSSVQLLRARQGYKERMRTLQSTWARGVIEDHSIALICSASLFEELTSGGAAGVEILNQAFSMVLPEKRRQSYQLEFLFTYYLKTIQKHYKLSEVWEAIIQGLQLYPSSPKFFNTLVEIGRVYTVPNKLREIFDNYCHKKPSVIVWIFALAFEMSKGGGGSANRIHGLFERALVNDGLRSSVVLWRCYIAYEVDIAHDFFAAKRIFFRAIHACPWSKKLWLDGFLKLSSVLTAKELSDLQEVMRDKELNVRTDIYEILLQDDMAS